MIDITCGDAPKYRGYFITAITDMEHKYRLVTGQNLTFSFHNV